MPVIKEIFFVFFHAGKQAPERTITGTCNGSGPHWRWWCFERVIECEGVNSDTRPSMIGHCIFLIPGNSLRFFERSIPWTSNDTTSEENMRYGSHTRKLTTTPRELRNMANWVYKGRMLLADREQHRIGHKHLP
jgi:hypothetical protein